ncbi:MAG: ABC transporter substrate-binding protein [Deltaproteobacteria bacterium]|nr:ABC transporter substrate-binding protein [Deltaproteobacteria bacterium]
MVPLKGEPQRVISVNGSATELLLRLGLEKKIVGTAYLDNPVAQDLQAAYESAPVIAERYPTRERVLALEPDFIYGWGSAFKPQALGDVKYWHNLGIATFISRNSVLKPQRIDNFFLDIANLGKIFNIDDKVENYILSAKSEFEKIQKIVKGAKIKKKLIIGEYLPNKLFLAYGSTSLVSEMLAIAGGENLLPNGAILSAEGLVDLNPPVIVMIHMLKTEGDVASHLDEIRKDPILSKLDSVKSAHVYPMPLAEAHCAGVRISSGVARLAQYLYPDLFSE